MNKNRKLAVGALLVVSIAGLAGLGLTASRERGVEVRAEVVGRRDLTSVVTASGVIQPKRKVDISADVSGRVVELAVEEGQTVRKGDLLLRIDPTAFQAAVRRAVAAVAQARAHAAQARANLLQAQSAERRADQLAQGERLISHQDLEQARTQLKVAEAQYEAARYGVSQAEASLNEAQEELRKTTILAPMAGRVTRLNIEEGETAIVGTMNNPGSLLLTIADLSVMEANVVVDETDVPHIAHRDSALVRIDAFPGQTFTGRVTRISNSSIKAAGVGAVSQGQGQAQSVDFEVIITLDQPPRELRPDLSATAEIVTAQRRQVLAVPIIAVTVRDRDGKKFLSGDEEDDADALTGAEPAKREEVEGVFVVREGTARFLPVAVGIAGDRYFEVLRGLKGGERVVVGPYAVIRDLEEGGPVRAPQPEEATAAAPAREKR